MERLRESECGFTLLEVIVAVMIISLLAVSFAPLITSSVQRIRWAGERMEELYVMQSEMERAMAMASAVSEQELVVRGQNGYASEPVNGMVVKVGDLVSFLSPGRVGGED